MKFKQIKNLKKGEVFELSSFSGIYKRGNYFPGKKVYFCPSLDGYTYLELSSEVKVKVL